MSAALITQKREGKRKKGIKSLMSQTAPKKSCFKIWTQNCSAPYSLVHIILISSVTINIIVQGLPQVTTLLRWKKEEKNKEYHTEQTRKISSNENSNRLSHSNLQTGRQRMPTRQMILTFTRDCLDSHHLFWRNVHCCCTEVQCQDSI